MNMNAEALVRPNLKVTFFRIQQISNFFIVDFHHGYLHLRFNMIG